MAEAIELPEYGGHEANVTGDDETEFNMVINSGTAELSSDLPTWAGGQKIPRGWKQEEVESRAATERRIAEFDTTRHKLSYTVTRSNLEFEAKTDGALYVKWGRNWVHLTKVDSMEFLAPSTVSKEAGAGGAQLLEALGYKSATPVAPLRSRKTQAALTNV